MLRLIIASILLITVPNYNTLNFEYKFSSTCASLSKILHKIQAINRWLVICGDFSTNWNDSSLTHARMFLSSLPLGISVLPKSKSFSYNHNSGSTSNFNFVLSDLPELKSIVITVSDDIPLSDHLYLQFNIYTYPLHKIRQNSVGLQKYYGITYIYRSLLHAWFFADEN